MPLSLQKLQILKGKNTKTEMTFNQVMKMLNVDSFEDIVYDKPHEYVTKIWSAFKSLGKKSNTLNGSIFETIIDTLLYREGILPYYLQASVAFVPNVYFDLVLYRAEYPVSLSLKTSLRERYKQADLEAIAMKYVHRKAKCYLLTLNQSEADSVNDKIKQGQAIGLDMAILCSDDTFDTLIGELRQQVFQESVPVEVITGRLVNKK